jgi:hypothetical protein
MIEILSQIFLTLTSAILGGLVVHLLTISRDKTNKRRDNRIKYLIEAYRSMEASVQRNNDMSEKDVESAIADIQLLGTVSQAKLAHEFAASFANEQTANISELLENLRADLRRELTLEEIPLNIKHLRFRKK